MKESAIAVSTIWTAPDAKNFVVQGVSGGGGGGGGAFRAEGQPGKPAPWQRIDAALEPGRDYVIVVGAGGPGGRGATEDDDRGEDGGAGGISFLADGRGLIHVLARTASVSHSAPVGPAVSNSRPGSTGATLPPTVTTAPRFAIIDSVTRKVENVVIADPSFFVHPLAREVVLKSRLVEKHGQYLMEPRSQDATFVRLREVERAAPGWLFIDAVAPFEGSSPPEPGGESENARFFEPAWPRRTRVPIGAPGGSGAMRKPKPIRPDTYRILAVATEWFSAQGGISTINRNLCLSLAQLHQTVICLVPPGTVDDSERAHASAGGVRIVDAPSTLGKDVGMLACLQRKPKLPDDFVPDVVIGHGHVTGFAAHTQFQDFFRDALLVHLVHTRPGDIEWYKSRQADGGERVEASEEKETILARAAALVVGVGPKLKSQADMYLQPYDNPPPTHELTPGAVVAFATARIPPEVECLFIGRVEDEKLKGLDIATKAVAHARLAGHSVRLVVCGAEPGSTSTLHERLSLLVGAPSAVKVYPFNPNESAIRAHFLSASLVLMPSRTEGFGLVGLEAIALGVPVLVSAESGLAVVLQRDFPEFAATSVVPLTGDEQENYRVWGHRASQVLEDRDSAFRRAVELRKAWGARYTWQAAGMALLQAIRASHAGERA